MKTLIAIPARYASTRYPGKPLVVLRGPDGEKTLIRRSWEAAMAVQGIDRVVVATDDSRIADHAAGFGAEVVIDGDGYDDASAVAAIDRAIDAGVSAYVVDGLKKERIKPILDTTISRFNAFSRLRTELEQAKGQLEERKIIDRAKGILMRSKGIDEEQAYALLRKVAMNEKKKISEIAQSVVTAAELLG